MVDPPFIQGYDDFWPLYVSIKTDFYEMALESLLNLILFQFYKWIKTDKFFVINLKLERLTFSKIELIVLTPVLT